MERSWRQTWPCLAAAAFLPLAAGCTTTTTRLVKGPSLAVISPDREVLSVQTRAGDKIEFPNGATIERDAGRLVGMRPGGSFVFVLRRDDIREYSRSVEPDGSTVLRNVHCKDARIFEQAFVVSMTPEAYVLTLDPKKIPPPVVELPFSEIETALVRERRFNAFPLCVLAGLTVVFLASPPFDGLLR